MRVVLLIVVLAHRALMIAMARESPVGHTCMRRGGRLVTTDCDYEGCNGKQ
jgi:hypothetical protein